jgi:hypothetical protein
MKARIATLMALTAACRVALAADTMPAITTTDGKTYDHITAQRVDPDGLYIEYAPGGKGMGCAKLKFNRLSPDMQKEYGYDADAAKKYEDDTYKATLAFQSWAEQQDAAGQKARADAAARDLQEETILPQPIPVAADQAPADYANYGGGWYYGGALRYGRQARRNTWTGAAFQGAVPQDRLVTPQGFSPTRTQFFSATPRAGQNFGTASARQR